MIRIFCIEKIFFIRNWKVSKSKRDTKNGVNEEEEYTTNFNLVKRLFLHLDLKKHFLFKTGKFQSQKVQL